MTSTMPRTSGRRGPQSRLSSRWVALALLLPGSTPAGGPSAGAVDARLSPDGGFLYVDQGKTGAMAAFAVNGGRLTQLGASPFPPPAGAAPAGIIVS